MLCETKIMISNQRCHAFSREKIFLESARKHIMRNFKTNTLQLMLLPLSKQGEWNEGNVRHACVKITNKYEVSVERHDRMRSLGRPTYIWENNIKMSHKYKGKSFGLNYSSVLWHADPFLGNEVTNTLPGIREWKLQTLGKQLVAVESTGKSMDTSNQQTFPKISLRCISGRWDKNQVRLPCEGSICCTEPRLREALQILYITVLISCKYFQCFVYMYILTSDRLLMTDWQTTEPSSRQRGRPKFDRTANYKNKERNIWSWAPDGARHQDRPTDWPSVVKWLWLWLWLC
jgi:hypothetical protein